MNKKSSHVLSAGAMFVLGSAKKSTLGTHKQSTPSLDERSSVSSKASKKAKNRNPAVAQGTSQINPAIAKQKSILRRSLPIVVVIIKASSPSNSLRGKRCSSSAAQMPLIATVLSLSNFSLLRSLSCCLQSSRPVQLCDSSMRCLPQK
jgi:hypothetical protein